eukprot:7389364-Prymnesium_polylepis.1
MQAPEGSWGHRRSERLSQADPPRRRPPLPSECWSSSCRELVHSQQSGLRGPPTLSGQNSKQREPALRRRRRRSESLGL